MSNPPSTDPKLNPHVYPTGDGERSTAGSNYGDWRPAQPHRPHGYDFESGFVPPSLDPDYQPVADDGDAKPSP